MKITKRISAQDIRKVAEDKLREIWDGKGSYRRFASKHLESLGVGMQPDKKVPENVRLPNANVNWSNVAPELRVEFLRRKIDSAHRQALEDVDDRLEIKKGIPSPKRGKKRGEEESDNVERGPKKKKHRKRDRDNKNTPNPSPKPRDGGETRPPLKPPKPRDTDSPPRPPKKKKSSWDSRVGYFMALSDVTWYSESPKIHESPYVDLHFEEEEKEYLKLRPGDGWLSDWYETGVIRGLDVNVVGKHKLNYSKNGDFEV